MTKKRIAFLSVSAALLVLLLAGALFGQTTQRSNIYRYLSIFSEVLDLVRSSYVDQVSSDQLMDGAATIWLSTIYGVSVTSDQDQETA